jgi:hypothetical protein
MKATPRNPATSSDQPSDEQRPRHPTRQATVLLVGVTMVIVALAVLSSYGWL